MIGWDGPALDCIMRTPFIWKLPGKVFEGIATLWAGHVHAAIGDRLGGSPYNGEGIDRETGRSRCKSQSNITDEM